ncbi:MAG: hypothetical protein ABIK47_00375 [candidate division WOR-3 bacterium]
MPRSIGERLRIAARSGHKKLYWLTVLTLSVVAILSIIIFGPERKRVSLSLPRLVYPQPYYQIDTVIEMPRERQGRLTVLAVTRQGLGADSLRAILDWVLFSVLDEYSKRKRQNIQVIWAYLYEDTIVSLSYWRAMAVYVDPRLPSSLVPDAARIGGDAIRDGAIEYDFTNPLTIK